MYIIDKIVYRPNITNHVKLTSSSTTTSYMYVITIMQLFTKSIFTVMKGLIMMNRQLLIFRNLLKIFNTCRDTSIIDKKMCHIQFNWPNCGFSSALFYLKMENIRRLLHLLKKHYKKLSNLSEYLKLYVSKSSWPVDFLKLIITPGKVELKSKLSISKPKYFMKLKNYSNNSHIFLKLINWQFNSKRNTILWCNF